MRTNPHVSIGTDAPESERKRKMSGLQGKVAVMTGGSSGIGLATAQRFVKEGAFVYITGRRPNELDMTAALIGEGLTTVRGDVQNFHDLERLYERVKEKKGKIDILVAGAGFIDPQPLVDVRSCARGRRNSRTEASVSMRSAPARLTRPSLTRRRQRRKALTRYGRALRPPLRETALAAPTRLPPRRCSSLPTRAATLPVPIWSSTAA
jgi:NAD(P)-dependent dehydrogenase (short-subunit alcohol dehydrogenase family)